MRVLSYNVRSLRDDPALVARVIRACAPDIVCVQEAPRFFGWRRRCARLAAESGLFVVTGGRPAGAMLLLARPGVRFSASYDVLLSKRAGLHQRGLAVGVSGGVAYASMHLDLSADDRLRHVGEIFGVLDALGAPVVLAGDVNETPGHPAWEALTGRLQDAYAVAPVGDGRTMGRRRIDGVFVDRSLRVVRCGVPELSGVDFARASDHRPVLADIEV